MTVVVKNSDIFFLCLFYIIAKELLAKDYCLPYGGLPKSCLPNYCLPYGGLPMITACLMAACLFTLLPFYPLAKLLVSHNDVFSFFFSPAFFYKKIVLQTTT